MLDSPRTPDPARRSGRRLAIVEDNAELRETLSALFAAHGYLVEQASDGPEGLDLLLDDPPPVALLDIGLPLLDGFALARAVRARWPRERVRLLALTGYGQRLDRARELEAGFDEHLVKPATLAEIQAALG